VSARLEELSRDMAQHEYVAGTRLRMLAVELTKRPNIKVSLVTYQDESRDLDGGQELEVVFTDDPHCEPVMIDRDGCFFLRDVLFPGILVTRRG